MHQLSIAVHHSADFHHGILLRQNFRRPPLLGARRELTQREGRTTKDHLQDSSVQAGHGLGTHSVVFHHIVGTLRFHRNHDVSRPGWCCASSLVNSSRLYAGGTLLLRRLQKSFISESALLSKFLIT